MNNIPSQLVHGGYNVKRISFFKVLLSLYIPHVLPLADRNLTAALDSQ